MRKRQRNVMRKGEKEEGKERGKKDERREDKRREGRGEGRGNNLVQQVTGTLVCQSGGRQDGCHVSLEPRLRSLES